MVGVGELGGEQTAEGGDVLGIAGADAVGELTHHPCVVDRQRPEQCPGGPRRLEVPAGGGLDGAAGGVVVEVDGAGEGGGVDGGHTGGGAVARHGPRAAVGAALALPPGGGLDGRPVEVGDGGDELGDGGFVGWPGVVDHLAVER